VTGEPIVAAELHAAALSDLMGEQISIYSATQTLVIEERLNFIGHILLKAWEGRYITERFPLT
jgi:hypothetical protein